MSDIVFVKTWFSVEIPKFYAPVTNLLLCDEDKTKWKGMKTVGEIKREKGLMNDVNPDHLYKEIKREPKVFNDLRVPRNLQRDLPYGLKPKTASMGAARNFDTERVHVELDSKEKKVRNLMKMITTVAGDKDDRLNAEKSRRIQDLINKHNTLEAKKFKKQKEARREVSKAMSKEAARKERLAAKGGGRGQKRKRGAE